MRRSLEKYIGVMPVSDVDVLNENMDPASVVIGWLLVSEAEEEVCIGRLVGRMADTDVYWLVGGDTNMDAASNLTDLAIRAAGCTAVEIPTPLEHIPPLEHNGLCASRTNSSWFFWRRSVSISRSSFAASFSSVSVSWRIRNKYRMNTLYVIAVN